MNQKIGVQIIAAFMVLTMVLSVFVMLFSGNSSDTSDNTTLPGDNQDEYFNINGKQVSHGFSSITDGLQMSPPDIYSAQFVDMESINTTTSQPWHEQLSTNLTMVVPLNKSNIDSLYQTSTKQVYLGQSFQDFILLSTMSPKNLPPSYIPSYSKDNQYMILERILEREDGSSSYNVMGDPTIYTSSLETTEAVLSILENFSVPRTAYDTFRPLLNHSDDLSQFQVVINMVYYPDHFADMYYLGLHQNDDGSFTRTTVYQNPVNDTVSHINELALSAQERGFAEYDVIVDRDIMKVVITGEFLAVTTEDNKYVNNINNIN